MSEHGQKLFEKLLHEEGIDWEGYRERNPSATWGGDKPVPIIRKNGDLYTRLLQEKEHLEKAMEPIEIGRLATLLHVMLAHYWQPDMSPELMKEFVKDHVRLLGGYPQNVFEEVRDEILQEPNRKFAPKIGEMKNLLDQKLWQKQHRLRKVNRLIEKAESTT